MLYRKFGSTNLETSILGFGCMRLPTVEDADENSDVGNIDKEEAIKMIRYGIDNGINYIDTAYTYHDEKSEVLLGYALQDGYREKVNLVTKLPIWKAEKYEDFNRLLDEQLTRLQTDYLDIYLVHALNKSRWEKAKELKVFDFLEQAVKDGKIKHVGFSFHDKLEVFKEIVDGYDWDVCQTQLNYIDENYQAGLEGMHYAAAKGMAIVIMEPLRGGRLTNNLSPEVQAIWDSASVKRTPAEWAFRWLYNHPEISVVLSGMSTMEQVVENIKTANEGHPNSLTEEEIDVVNRVKDFYHSKIRVHCTDCQYCLPCPQGVAIPQIFATYNDASIWDDFAGGARRYKGFIDKSTDASLCQECGLCEDACPQNLTIIEYLKEAAQALQG